MEKAAAVQRTRVRYKILAAVFVNVVINYMDRTNISVAATMVKDDLQLTKVQLGFIFSAFAWTYAALQIPGGILADRVRTRILYTICLIAWSLATLLQGFVAGFALLFALRLAIGVFEAPSFPMNNSIVTSWFPDKERGSALGMYTSGQYLGLAFLAPILTSLQYYAGWQGLFIVTGIAGIIWGIVWYFIYRDPLEHPRANKEELEYIESGGGLINKVAGKNQNPFRWADLKEVFSHRKLWGIYLGQFCLGSTLWFFLTWFPIYLVEYRGMDFLKSGFLAAIPFLAATAGILCSGFVSDYMMKKGLSQGTARKTPVIIGLLLTVSIIGANYANSTAWIIFFMCTAFFGNGFAAITWIFVSSLAPKHLIGLTGGVFNFIGNLSAIFIPLIIGFIVKGGDFKPALILVGCLGATGTLCYLFLVGKVERIEVKAEQEH